MTIEDEAQAAAEQRYPLFNDRLDYPSAAVTHYMRDAFQSGAKWAASHTTGETHDEDTLRKVYDALESVTGSEVEADDCIHAMQNAGILFRERVKGDAKLPENSEPVPEREALSELLMSIYDHGTQPNALREADAILTSDVWRNRHPQPTEGEPTEDIRGLLAEADALVEAWDRKGSWTPDSPVGLVMRLASALRAARVADQEGEGR